LIKIENNSQIIEVHSLEEEGYYTVITQFQTKLQANPAIVFKRIHKNDLIDALRSQNSLDRFAPQVFTNLSDYIENGYKIDQFHKSMVLLLITQDRVYSKR
jgi:hypothetical protein